MWPPGENLPPAPADPLPLSPLPPCTPRRQGAHVRKEGLVKAPLSHSISHFLPFPFSVELCDFRATPNSPPTRVAVKRLRPGCALDAVDLAAEARVLASLRHPNIVRFLGVGASPSASTRAASASPRGRSPAAAPADALRDDCCYLVQAFVSGGTLKRAVGSVAARPAGSPPPYSLKDAAAWGADVAAGLAFLHSSNPVIVHRDLKLENVLLTKADEYSGEGTEWREAGLRRSIALLADFGLAASFVSPDLCTRRSALARTPTSAWWKAAGGSQQPQAEAAPPTTTLDLGHPRASAVAVQLQRLAAGEAMDDARVSAAAGALEAALSAWGEGKEQKGQKPKHAQNRHVFALTAKTGEKRERMRESTRPRAHAGGHSLAVLSNLRPSFFSLF